MTLKVFRSPFVAAAVTVFSLALCHRPAHAAEKPKIAYLGSEGRDLSRQLQKVFDEAVWKGLRDTQSVQSVTVNRPPRTVDNRPCITQICAAAAASQSGAQFLFKARLVETVQQGSPTYQVKLMAVQALPYDVVATHDFEVRDSIPEELAVRTDPQVAVLVKKMIRFLESKKDEAGSGREAPASLAPASRDTDATPDSGHRWRRWSWLLLGAAGTGAIARGGLLIHRDGKGACAAGVPTPACGARYDTARPGWIATGAGLAALVAGLWGFVSLDGDGDGDENENTKIGLGVDGVVMKGTF